MKITIIYDNTARDGFIAKWGFSCFIEVNNKHIIFDTGGDSKVLLYNMSKLQINPEIVDIIVLSHNHWDHTGGLSGLLEKNNHKAKVFGPTDYSKPTKICSEVYSTGSLGTFIKEQSIIIKSEKGLVVIVGCSHPGVDLILKTAEKLGKPYALIGGLHGFNKFDLINNLELVCPTHCTQYIKEIKKIYPDKYIEGGVGTVIEI